ncbi:MAG: alpha/beta hydrolase, partial [Nitrospira sp.]|nr:alpha/beta hydrolase [Nitrospira sp.]
MGILDQFFVYYPKPWQDHDWVRISGLPLEDVWFQSGDGVRLFGWYIESRADRPVMLWCHGNAGNIIHRLDNVGHLYRMGLS